MTFKFKINFVGSILKVHCFAANYIVENYCQRQSKYQLFSFWNTSFAEKIFCFAKCKQKGFSIVYNNIVRFVHRYSDSAGCLDIRNLCGSQKPNSQANIDDNIHRPGQTLISAESRCVSKSKLYAMSCCVAKKIPDGINAGRKMEPAYSSSTNGLFLWWNGGLIAFLIRTEYSSECAVNCVIHKRPLLDSGGSSEVYIWNGAIFRCGSSTRC